MPKVKDLIFKDVYIDEARTKVMVRIRLFSGRFSFVDLVTLNCVCAERW